VKNGRGRITKFGKSKISRSAYALTASEFATKMHSIARVFKEPVL